MMNQHQLSSSTITRHHFIIHTQKSHRHKLPLVITYTLSILISVKDYSNLIFNLLILNMRYVYTHSLLQMIIFLTPFFTSVFLCEAGIFGQSPSATAEHKWKTKTQAQKKPSLLKVDPKNIVRLICKYAGVVMPASVTRDMEIISSVCNCNDVSLDLINKELLIHNFTVTMPSSKKNKQECTALSVGTISMSWDSYLQPCIDIIVGDVDILVEFVNIMLTKNNWYVER